MRHKTTIKSLCALCALAGSVQASGANIVATDSESLDIFGRVKVIYGNYNALNNIDFTKTNSYGDTALATTARFGLAGRTQIKNGLDAVMMGVFDFTTQDNKQGAQYLFVGIDAYEYGTLLFGKGDGAFYTIAGAGDIFSHFKTRANDYYLTGDRLPSQIMYSLSALGFDLRLSYNFNDSQVNNTPFAIRENVGASVSNEFGAITFAYGLNYTDFKNKHDADFNAMREFFTPILANSYQISADEAFVLYRTHGPSRKLDYGFALSYGTFGKGYYGSFIYTASDYQHIDHKLFSYEIVNNYTFDNGLGIIAGYALKTFSGSAVVSDLTTGVYYNVNPAFKIYAEAQIDLGSDPHKFYGASAAQYIAQDKYVAGFEYNF